MDILGKIKSMQSEMQWTEAELATRSKLSQSTISSMYKRDNLPTIPTLISICNAFGITITQFFAECDIPSGLTEDQTELLVHWNVLNDEQKDILIRLIKSMHSSR